MKFNNLQNNFTGGEWSPQLKGRTDLQQYFHSCETMENFIPRSQGGAFRRPSSIARIITDSTRNTDLQKAVSNNCQIVPWSLSNGTRYLLVMNQGNPFDWFLLNLTSTVPAEESIFLVSTALNTTWSSAQIATQKLCALP